MIKVDANGVQASKTFEALEKQMKGMSKSLANIGKSMSLYVTAPLTALAAVSVKNADTQQQAEAKLLTALRGREDIQQRLIKSAGALQERSTLGDEAIIAQQAFLASLGLTEQQINDTIEAAVQLSYATGMQLESAVKNLAKTYGGLAGELGESIPAMKQFTKEQMQQGAAVKFVNENYKGFAETAAATGSGPLKQLKNQFGDLLEQLGNLLYPAINKLVFILKDVVTWFQNLSSSTQATIVAFGTFAASVGPILLAFSKITNASTSVIKSLVSLKDLLSSFGGITGLALTGLITVANYFDLWHTKTERLIRQQKEIADQIADQRAQSVIKYTVELEADYANMSAEKMQKIRDQAFKDMHYYNERAKSGSIGGTEEERRLYWEDMIDRANFAEAQIKAIDNVTKARERGLGSFQTTVEKSKGLIGDLQSRIKQLNDSLPWLKSRDQIIEVQRQIAILQTQLNDIESAYENISTAVTATTEINKSALTAAPTLAAGDLSEYNKLKPTIDWSSKSDIDSMNKWTADIVDASAAISSTVSKAIEDMAVTIGEGLGDMLSGGEWNPIETIMKLIGAALKELGKQLIKIAGLGEVIKKALDNIIIAPWLALGAGVAAIALGQMIQNLSAKPLALAEGGLAFGPTLALIGDNRGAASNPEVVAPLSKLRKMIDTSSSRISFDGAEFIISGDALRAVLRREDMRVAALG